MKFMLKKKLVCKSNNIIFDTTQMEIVVDTLYNICPDNFETMYFIMSRDTLNHTDKYTTSAYERFYIQSCCPIFQGIPIAIYDNLQLGEVEIVCDLSDDSIAILKEELCKDHTELQIDKLTIFEELEYLLSKRED